MKQLQFFKYAAGILALLNIAMLAFFFLTKPPVPPPMKGGARPFHHRAVELLDLNPEQQAAFKDLARRHSQLMRSINRQQSDWIEPYFQAIVDTSKDLESNAIMDTILQLERRKIEATAQHFEQVKSLLKESQLANFELFVSESLKVILPGGRNNQPPPKDF